MLTTKNTKALTLVEVLLFVWVLTLLTCLFLGWYEPKKRTSHGVGCLGQLRQIAIAMKMYAQDDLKRNFFPIASPRPASSNELFQTFLMDVYVKSAQVFRCPRDKLLSPHLTGRVADGRQNSYASVHNVKDDDSRDTAILADSVGHLSVDGVMVGLNMFYADGHGSWGTVTPTLTERLDADYGEPPAQAIRAILDEQRRKNNLRLTFRILVGGLVVVFLFGCAWAFQRNRRKKQPEEQRGNSG